MPRCPHCGLTVMTCPDLRWVRYYGVYPIWMGKSLADRIMASPIESADWWPEADMLALAWTRRLHFLQIL